MLVLFSFPSWPPSWPERACRCTSPAPRPQPFAIMAINKQTPIYIVHIQPSLCRLRAFLRAARSAARLAIHTPPSHLGHFRGGRPTPLSAHCVHGRTGIERRVEQIKCKQPPKKEAEGVNKKDEQKRASGYARLSVCA